MVHKVLHVSVDSLMVGTTDRSPSQDLAGNLVTLPILYRLHLGGDYYVVLPFDWDPDVIVILDHPKSSKKNVADQKEGESNDL